MISDWVAKYTQCMVPTTPPPPINIKPDLGFSRERPLRSGKYRNSGKISCLSKVRMDIQSRVNFG